MNSPNKNKHHQSNTFSTIQKMKSTINLNIKPEPSKLGKILKK